MKNMTKKIWIGFLALVVILGITSCPNESSDNDPFYSVGNTITVGNYQVWERNYETKRIREAHYEFKGNRSVGAYSYVPVYDEDGNITDYPLQKIASSGNIKDGKISFSVEELEDSSLLPNSDVLLLFIFREWFQNFWTNTVQINVDIGQTIAVAPLDVKGNSIQYLRTESDLLSWELLTGTSDSLSMEYVWFLYMDKACHVTADEFTIGLGLDYTFKELDLYFNQGWNMLCKKETYTTSGNSSYSFEIKKPNYKWTLVDISKGFNLRDFDLEE